MQASTKSLMGAVLAVGLLSPATASAALLAEESFEYSEGVLAGNGPGNGFGTNVWVEGTLDTSNPVNVVSPSLSFTSGPFETASPYTAGNRASLPTNRERATIALDTTPTSIFANAGLVDGSGNIGADGTTLYISYMMQVNEVKDYIGLEGYRDGSRAWFLGRLGSDPIVTEGLTKQGDFGSITKNTEDLYVLKIDFQADGGDQITGWLSPTPGEPAPTPTFSNINVGDFSFDSLAIWENAAGTSIAANFDEIRIGTSFEDVTSDVEVSIIPEPGTLSMAGALLGLLAHRRRR